MADQAVKADTLVRRCRWLPLADKRVGLTAAPTMSASAQAAKEEMTPHPVDVNTEVAERAEEGQRPNG